MPAQKPQPMHFSSSTTYSYDPSVVLDPADGTPVTGCLTHVAVPACSAGHAFVRLLFRCKVPSADVIIFRLDRS